MNIISEDWEETIEIATEHLLNYGKSINRGSWQGYRTEGKPDLETLEVLNLTIEGKVHKDLQRLQDEIKPNLPWADDHFAERVSRAPSNPGEAYLDWPWWRGQHAVTQEGGVFTHTY